MAEAETRRRVNTSGSSTEEEVVILVMEDELDRPGTPDSETTDEEPGNILMKKHRKDKDDTPLTRALTSGRKLPWRSQYFTERLVQTNIPSIDTKVIYSIERRIKCDGLFSNASNLKYSLINTCFVIVSKFSYKFAKLYMHSSNFLTI